MAHNSCSHVASSQKALMLEMKSLQEEPVEGFKITLVDEADLYNWEVAIFGPPNTLYEGGYFKVRLVNFSTLYVSCNIFQSAPVSLAIYSNAPALYLSSWSQHCQVANASFVLINLQRLQFRYRNWRFIRTTYSLSIQNFSFWGLFVCLDRSCMTFES